MKLQNQTHVNLCCCSSSSLLCSFTILLHFVNFTKSKSNTPPSSPTSTDGREVFVRELSTVKLSLRSCSARNSDNRFKSLGLSNDPPLGTNMDLARDSEYEMNEVSRQIITNFVQALRGLAVRETSNQTNPS